MADTSDSLYFPNHSNDTFTTTSKAQLARKNSRGLLVGPSDCRRLGAQLRPHIFSRLFHLDSYRCAGLVSKDLSTIGGHNVINFGEAALEMEEGGTSLIHLGCDSAVTGLVSGYHRATEGPEENRVTGLIQVAAKDEMEGYIKRRSGQSSPLAYVLAPKGCFSGSDLVFFGLRLPEPSVLEEDQEEYLVYCAGEASFVGVSGKSAETFLTDRGVKCEQMPCGLAVLPRLCREQLEESEKVSRAIRAVYERFGKGWVAVEVGDVPEQYESDFADAVSSLAADRGWGVMIYSGKCLGEETGEFKGKWETLLGRYGNAEWFDSDSIWDIACLIGNAKLYTGSCLDSRIVASSFSVPRINLPRADRRNIDYCEVWEEDSLAAILSGNREEWESEMKRAADADPSKLQKHAEVNARAFFEGFGKACEKTSLLPRFFGGETIDHLQAMVYSQQVVSDFKKTDKRFAKPNRRRARQSKGQVAETSGSKAVEAR